MSYFVVGKETKTPHAAKGLDCVQAGRTISEPIVGDDQIDRRIAGHRRLRMNLLHLGGLIA
jgi:hypothetical protein